MCNLTVADLCKGQSKAAPLQWEPRGYYAAGRREHWISFSMHTGITEQVGTQTCLVSCP